MTLSSRLFAAFAALALIVVLAMAWITHGLVSGLFIDYLDVTRPWQASMVEQLVTDAYAQNGWAGVQQALNSMDQMMTGTTNEDNAVRPGYGPHGPGMMNRPGTMMGGQGNGFGQGFAGGAGVVPPIVVTDTAGTVRASTAQVPAGAKVDSDLLNMGYPLETAAGPFGLLVFNPDQQAAASPLLRWLSPLLASTLGVQASPEAAYQAAVTRATWFTALLAVALAALMGWWVSRLLTRPLTTVVRGADRFANSDFEHQIEVSGTPELTHLASALNTMATRIAATRQRERQLFADIAHELRTPLTIMRGQLDSLQEGTAASPERVVLSVQDEILRMSRFVSDLGQLSLVEVGNLPLKREEVTVDELVDPVVEGFQPEAQSRGVVLRRVDSQLGHGSNGRTLNVDSMRIQQVLANLIGNALRHTPQGGSITVADTPGAHEVTISVADTGEGIAGEALAHIFDRFYRGEPSANRDTGGTGLGLAIARGYVEAHGGRIWAESERGQGTTVHFSLPYDG